MGDPYISEIRLMAFNFAPKGWAMCNGQLLPINQNQALFSLLGTTYGGNGQTNFALPDLRDRVPIQVGLNFTQGAAGGEAVHTLTLAEMAGHTHPFLGTGATATRNAPGTNTVVAAATGNLYGPPNNPLAMDRRAVSTVGNSGPHENRQPFLVVTFCIALQGVYPNRN